MSFFFLNKKAQTDVFGRECITGAIATGPKFCCHNSENHWPADSTEKLEKLEFQS